MFKSFAQRVFGGGERWVRAIDGVSFRVEEGEVFGLVGESGCGKTTIARTLVGLVRPTAGTIRYMGRDVTHPDPSELVALRRDIQMVFQDPHAALNPALTTGEAIADVLRTHGIAREDGGRAPPSSDEALWAEVRRTLEAVGLRPPDEFLRKFPDELSGGQKQRLVMGRAIALRPRIIVADEPVAMLDMSIRARILQFLLDLRTRFGLTYVFITHDLATAKLVCDRIAIMYLGRIVEMGAADRIFADPKHPYTQALLQAIPIPNPERRRSKALPRGEVPDAAQPPAGCRFHPRCPVALPTCGWEGRDFIDYLQQRRLDPERARRDAEVLGPLEAWRPEGFVAVWQLRDEDASKALEAVREARQQAPPAMRHAVIGVNVDGRRIIVIFRAPDPLYPKDVEGRTVECLLY